LARNAYRVVTFAIISSRYFQKVVPYIVVGSITILLLPILYRSIAYQPNQLLFSASGDGLMMDFQAMWQACYGKGLYFEGFNYPYKEGLSYAGGQAGIGALLAGLRGLGLPVHGYAMGIANTIVLSLVVIGALVSVRLLQLLKVSMLWQVIGALLIVFMAPVVERIYGHICLGYPFFIPTCFYLSYSFYLGKGRIGTLCLLFGVMSFFGFNNAYYSAIGTIVFAMISGILTLITRERKAMQLLLCSAASFLALALNITYINPSPDRVKYAYGYSEYATTPLGLCIPQYKELHGFFSDLGVNEFRSNEAVCYVGLSTCIFFVVGLVWYFSTRRKYLLRSLSKDHVFWLSSVLATGFMFLLACNFIFALNQDWFTEHFYLLFKFRASGRLAWPFATLLIILSIVAVDRMLQQVRSKVLAIILGVLCVTVWATDAYYTIKSKVYDVYWISEPNLFHQDALEKLSWPSTTVQPADFQAITILPLLCFWSDKHEFAPMQQDYVTKHAMQLSLRYHLPLTSSMLSRVSYKHTLQHGQLLAHGSLPRDLFADLPSQKPLLFVVGPDTSLRPQELVLLKHRCTFIGDLAPAIRLFSFAPKHDFNAARDSMLKLPSTTPIVTEHYNPGQRGLNPIDGPCISSQDLYQQKILPNIDDVDSVKLSFWSQSDPMWYGFTHFTLQVIDSSSAGSKYYETDVKCHHEYDSYNLWIRKELVVPIFSKNSIIKFFPQRQHFAIDRVQISRVGDLARDTSAVGIWVDNYLCKPSR
jgi:hypothetical protein